MAGLVDIFRLAMSHIDDRPIMSPAEETLQARLCRQNYELSRDAVLQAAPWTFASRRKLLSSNGEPEFGWKYQSQLPSEFLRVNGISSSPEPNGPTIPYVIEGRLILTNFSPIYLRFGVKETATGRFTPLFVQALGAHIAGTIGGALGASSNRIQQAWQLYRGFRDEAEYVDSTQSDQDPPLEGSWLRARHEPSDFGEVR